jgi:hypothetical protein
MNSRFSRILVRLYPQWWRTRYGKEFEEFLQNNPGDFRSGANVVWSALRERLTPPPGLAVDAYPSSVIALTKKPSAYLPMAMSLTALGFVLGHIAIFGVVREADEGTAAHIWQLLMAGQMPILAVFAVKWLPRVPRQTLGVLALQALAALASLAPVLYFNL